MIRRLSRHLDRNPLLAMLLGAVVAFLIVYLAAPSLVERVEQPTQRSAT